MCTPFLVFKGIEYAIKNNLEEEYWKQYKEYFIYTEEQILKIKYNIEYEKNNLH